MFGGSVYLEVAVNGQSLFVIDAASGGRMSRGADAAAF
jgi:hypothetical protein